MVTQSAVVLRGMTWAEIDDDGVLDFGGGEEAQPVRQRQVEPEVSCMPLMIIVLHMSDNSRTRRLFPKAEKHCTRLDLIVNPPDVTTKCCYVFGISLL